MLKRNKLALSVSAAVLSGGLMAPLAMAQATGDALEEVTVTGIRGALQSAMDTKRDANAVVDSISAEDIGKFPDKNIAESLQRVPGVAINRGFAGEGGEVSIRGVDPELTQTLLNGQFVASTSWFSLAFNKRSFNMDLMPSEAVKSVEVYKSPVASLDEGGVGGTVILNTRKPLEMDPFTVYASTELMSNSIDSGTAPTFNGMFSWKDDSNRFGIMGTISSAEIIGRANKAENYWEEGWGASGFANFDQDRERQTIDLNSQFAATEKLTLGAHYFETTLDATNTNHNFLVFSTGTSVYSEASGAPASSNGRPLQGTLLGATPGEGANGWVILDDVNTREPELKTDLKEFTADYDGGSYRVSGVIGSTKANGGNGGNVNTGWGLTPDSDLFAVNGGDVSVDFDMTKGTGMYMNVNGVDPADGSWQTLVAAPSLAETNLWDQEDFAQADFELDVDMGLIKTLKTGVKVRDHVFGKNQYDYTIDAAGVFGTTDGITLANSGFGGGTIDVGSEVAAGGSDSRYAAVNGDKLSSAVRNNVTARAFNYAAYGEVEEEINAFYVQADFEGERYRGNFGVRYVTTDVTAEAYVGQTPFKSTGDYSDVLPSVNFAYDLADDLILRTSASKVMSRPSYGTLNPAVGNINVEKNTAGAGDAGMDPFRANQFDLGLEWYFAENSYASAAVFYKDIDSFVTSDTIQGELPEPQTDGSVENQLYTLTVPAQGAGGYVQGMELSYQQMFGNFGVLANTTISDSEGEAADGSKTKLPGNSDLSYNLTGFYEDDMFSARAAYTYRDDYLAEGTAISGALDTFEGQSYLDLTFTWHATENLDFSLQGVNVLEEVTVQRHTLGEQTNRVTTENGSRYFLKASYRL